MIMNRNIVLQLLILLVLLTFSCRSQKRKSNKNTSTSIVTAAETSERMKALLPDGWLLERKDSVIKLTWQDTIGFTQSLGPGRGDNYESGVKQTFSYEIAFTQQWSLNDYEFYKKQNDSIWKIMNTYCSNPKYLEIYRDKNEEYKRLYNQLIRIPLFDYKQCSVYIYDNRPTLNLSHCHTHPDKTILHLDLFSSIVYNVVFKDKTNFTKEDEDFTEWYWGKIKFRPF